MWMAIGILGLLSCMIGIIGTIVVLFKRNGQWKKWLAGTGIAFVLFVVGAINDSPSTAKVETDQQKNVQMKDADQVSLLKTESPLFLTEAKVSKVIDGDTIHVTINGNNEIVQLIGINTPETQDPTKSVKSYGAEAEQFTRSQLEGKQVWLEKDVQERDADGKLLAYVWTSQPNEINDKEIREKMFNARLALEGYAQELTTSPDVKYSDSFSVYIREAKEGNKGLWGLASTPPSEQPANNNSSIKKVTQPIPASTPAPAPAVKTPTPEPAVNKQEVTVYITDTGSKYHSSGCQYLRKSQIPISLSDAKASGYTPCSKCGPPR